MLQAAEALGILSFVAGSLDKDSQSCMGTFFDVFSNVKAHTEPDSAKKDEDIESKVRFRSPRLIDKERTCCPCVAVLRCT